MLLMLCYAGFAGVAIMGAALGPVVCVMALAVIVTLHASLQHEVLHGHPFRSPFWNAVLVFPAIGLLVPYLRFQATHLAHHHDPHLTDPYDDPESNFMDPANWDRLWPVAKALFTFNNTLAGRMMVGPAIGLAQFYLWDVRLILQGRWRVLAAYLHHGIGVALVGIWWVTFATAPFWTLLVAAYLGMSILKIRSFLEHRAAEKAAARTVVIEDRGPLALLFLNNNFHAVHHAHPNVVWHRLPAVFRSRRAHFLRRNQGYLYRSYADVFRQYFLRCKDPVPHPLVIGTKGADRDHACKSGDVRPARIARGA